MSELLVREERWGWEFRDARPPPVAPFQDEPPRPDVPVPNWAASATDDRERAGRIRHLCKRVGIAALVLTPVAGLVMSSAAASAMLFAAIGCGVMAFSMPAAQRHRAEGDYLRWAGESLDRQRRFQAEHAAWASRREEHERHELEAGAEAPQWMPLRPATTERVDVFGGGAPSWASLLAASGTSLIGSGATVSVLDLTQDHVARALTAALAREAVSARTLTVPEQLPALNPLAGLTPEEIGVAIAEAVHAADPDAPAEARTVDATVIRQTAELLTEGPVTLDRLHAGLRVLLRQVAPGEPSSVTRAEYAALTDLLGEAARRSAEPRIFRLSADLERLATLAGRDGDPVPLAEFDAPLQVVALSEREPDLTSELLRQLLFQLALHRLRGLPVSDDRERVVVVAGADSLRRAHVERLDQLARRRRIRLVLLFRHLREDAVELIGGGDAVIFMRLGNAREAEHAATFIGKEHRFVAGQFTVSRTESASTSTSTTTTQSTSSQRSVTAGTQWSESSGRSWHGFLNPGSKNRGDTKGGQESTTESEGTSWSEGRSTSEQQGTSVGDSVSYQRVHEYTVTPSLLQSLSPTAFVLVDPRDPDGPRLGECDLALLEEPHVVDPPPPLPP